MSDKGKQAKEKSSKSPAELQPAASMRDEMDRALGRFLSDDWLSGFPRLGRMWELSGFPEFGRGAARSMLTMPKADLSEDDERFELTVELPGMTEKDLEVTVAEGALLVKGEKKEEKETREKDFHLTERSFGSVRRRFPLPPGVDSDKMDASFSSGVLKIVLPKTGEARKKTRKIEVRPA